MPAQRATEWEGIESLRLLHRNHTIDSGILEDLLAAARPVDRQLVDASGSTETEVKAAIILRKIPRSRDAFCNLLALAREQFYPRTNSIAIALGPFQRNRQPVIAVPRNIVQQRSLGSEIDHERVNLTV